MGHRVTQRIFQCDECNKTPDNGEYLWEMCGEHWCEDCCEKDNEKDECECDVLGSECHTCEVEL